MKKPSRRNMVLIAIAGLVVIAVVFAFLPDAVPVDVATAARGPLAVIVEEEGETRIEDRYVVTAPVAAYARRITLEPGDEVAQGEVLVQLEPPRTTALDPRSQNQANAQVRAAVAAVEEAAVVAQRADADRGRMQTLFDAGAITVREMEEARAAAIRAHAALDAARAQLTSARAAASRDGSSGSGVPDAIRAPAAGRVLAVHRRSEGHVNPGEPLLEVGDTRGIEVRSEVLSQDAVRIRPGMRVIVDEWGGDTPLEAVVTRVEPEGVTTVSALGVEEQRVPVIATLTSPAGEWAGLGSGYRVLARFVLEESPNALQIPASALFRSPDGDDWQVFVIEGGNAVRRAVSVAQQAGLVAGIRNGLREGEEVVVHPPNELEDGSRVKVRTRIGADQESGS